MQTNTWNGTILTIACMAAMPWSVHAQEPTEAEALFVRRVLPLLSEKCWSCHGDKSDQVEGGLNLKTRAGSLAGGDSGRPAIQPGQGANSPITLAVRRMDEHWSAMPPKDAQRLSSAEVEWLTTWIDSQAPWPDAQRVQAIQSLRAAAWASDDGIQVTTSGGLSAEWTNRRYQSDALWAYRPVILPETTAVGAAAIDELLARHWPSKAVVAEPAEARIFLRRASFDLTGLPPSLQEIEQFEAEYRSDPDRAVARCVDRLLESPHYGERMAQHWLDVVRYADSSGFANDYARGNAWRYRDYVVRSFSQDKPYDQFIVEQIAGDELLESEEHSPSNVAIKSNGDRASELLVAVGFLRMGPWELTGMEVARIARQRFLDDVTGSVGETFLAHSLQCARCHDHKFDPIPTRDYYALQAVFTSTQLVERPADFVDAENRNGFDESRYLEMSRDDLRATMDKLDAKSLAAAPAWLAQHSISDERWLAAVEQARGGGGNKRRGIYAAARGILLKDGLPEDQIPPRMLGWTPQEIGLERIGNKGLERLVWELDRYQPFALSVFNGPNPQVTSVNAPIRLPEKKARLRDVEPSHILVGGDPFSLGAAVEPAVLSAVSSLGGWSTDIPKTVNGRRLALARWIADGRNPLTARTLMNRLWLWHFDIPLAGNPNNFGGTGKRPTHPELLDWLAAEFVKNGWSIKAMHRLIMNSHAYRRSWRPVATEQSDNLEQMQAEYRVFKPRRLSAEEIRDSMLAASGELNREIGGIPVRPEINMEVALQPRQVMGTFAAAWVPNPLPEQRHRRSLYTLRLRGLIDPGLEVFNAPTPDFSCERREVSTVTPQVFTMLNSHASLTRSLALASNLLSEIGNRPGQVSVNDRRKVLDGCFQRVLGRHPNAEELRACSEHWESMTKAHARLTFKRQTPPKVIERDAVEENTGERFTYTERLFANADFVSDVQLADCDPQTRGLAEVCLSLLNTNEFIYVY